MQTLDKNRAIAVGSELRRTRREQGLTQRQLAEILGVSISFVSKVERGRMRRPTAELLAALDWIRGSTGPQQGAGPPSVIRVAGTPVATPRLTFRFTTLDAAPQGRMAIREVTINALGQVTVERNADRREVKIALEPPLDILLALDETW